MLLAPPQLISLPPDKGFKAGDVGQDTAKHDSSMDHALKQAQARADFINLIKMNREPRETAENMLKNGMTCKDDTRMVKATVSLAKAVPIIENGFMRLVPKINQH